MPTYLATKMNISVVCFLMGLLMLADFSLSKNADPKVQIYTRDPGHYEKDNILICHASGFHPPELSLELLMDGKEIPGANQTDLAFEENWYYHLTKHVNFKPEKGHQYSCRVIHLGTEKKYHWEADV